MKNPAMIKNVFSLVGMVAGLMLVIVGFTMGTDLNGPIEIKTVYGGDAYTGIQNAAAATSQGVSAVVDDLNALNGHFGMFVSLVGVLAICLFGTRMEWGAFSSKNSATTQAASAAAQPAVPAQPVAQPDPAVQPEPTTVAQPAIEPEAIASSEQARPDVPVAPTGYEAAADPAEQ